MTPDIRELLELAARASGIEIYRWPREDSEEYAPLVETHQHPISVRTWNPLEDEGDRARMEDALANGLVSFSVKHVPDRVIIEAETRFHIYSNMQKLSDHAGSRSAAHSMASLRVVAEIGRGMK